MSTCPSVGRRLSLLGVVMCLFTIVATGSAWADSTGGNFDVYSGSTPLADLAPGTVLDTRTLSYHVVGVSLPVTVVQLLYRSTGVLGQPTANVTSVLKPLVPSLGHRVVSLQSAYDSLNPADEPSAQIAGGATLGAAVFDAETALIAPFLAAGDTVVVPDTEGQTADFAAGPEYGMNTLDSLRAVERSSLTGVPSSAPVALIGYSGGAIGTDWAAQLAPSYAPEINRHLVGAAEGGVLVDPAHNLDYVGGTPVWSGVIPMAIIGIARAYKINLEQYMNSYGISVYNSLQNASITNALGEYPGLTWATLVQPAYSNPDSVPAYVQVVNELNMGSAPMPTVPMFIGQGAGGILEGTPPGGPGIGPGDGVMIAGDVRSLAREFCAAGDSVHYEQYDALSHTTSLPVWSLDAIPWVLARLAGIPEPSNCASITPGNSLAPQSVVQPSV